MKSRRGRIRETDPERSIDCWKLSLPCLQEDALRIEQEATVFPFGTLMLTQIDEADDLHWRLDCYIEAEPQSAAFAAFAALLPRARRRDIAIEPVYQADWLTLSQQSLEPVCVGRLFVHTSAYAHRVPPGKIALQIEAGQAFGTGSHATTRGCLQWLDALARRQRCHNILDLGCGSGILAFAAHKLWPKALVTASDIDPVAIGAARNYATQNGIALGNRHGQVRLCVAAGLQESLIRARAPYDLIIANILAGPLISLAPSISRALANNGTLLLAGLLNPQETAVTAAYKARRCHRAGRIVNGDWPSVRLIKSK